MSNAPLTPEQRIKELEQQLRDTQQKAEFFEAVVDVLKRDYGVSIVKKPRSKSSKKRRVRHKYCAMLPLSWHNQTSLLPKMPTRCLEV